MNFSKPLAVLFAIFSIGAFQETIRILTSSDSDIAQNRSSLTPMAITMTAGFIWATIYFWKKSKRKIL